MSTRTLTRVTQAYLEATAWCAIVTDDWTQLPQGITAAGIPEDYRKMAEDDCRDFLELLESEDLRWSDYWSPDQLGHDFYLTRNGHGTGFWDRAYGNSEYARMGDKLTELSKPYGPTDYAWTDEETGEEIYA